MARRPGPGDLAVIEELLERHLEMTGSTVAEKLLARLEDEHSAFWVVDGQGPVIASEMIATEEPALAP